jgi:predicted nucleotidyltransferase
MDLVAFARAVVERHPAITSLELVGSRARSDATELSDWDFLVETDDVDAVAADVEALVQASELFTPADIEFAARKAAQRAFEREHFEGSRQRARTDDFLAAIADTKPTLTAEIVSSFDEDTHRVARF